MKVEFSERKFIAIKTASNPIKVFGNAKKTFYLTSECGYVLKKICHSNTQLCVIDTVSTIKNMYELNEIDIDYKLLKKVIPFTDKTEDILMPNESLYKDFDIESAFSIRNYISSIANNTLVINSLRMQEVFGFGKKQLDDIFEKMMLIKVDENYFVRMEYKNIIKGLAFLINLKYSGGEVDEIKKYFPNYVCNWLITFFKVENYELCALIIAEHKNDYDKCKEQINNYIFEDLNFDEIAIFINDKFDGDKEMIEIIRKLQNM